MTTDTPLLEQSASPMRRAPWARSSVHLCGFAGVLVITWLAARWLDVPPEQKGFVLGAYGHELLLDVGLAITLAVSLNLILGITGQFSLGHAGFLAAGAYTSSVIAGNWFEPQLRFWVDGWLHLSVPAAFDMIMFTGVIAGALVAALLGLLVGLPTLRLRGDYLAIATLGFSEIFVAVVQNVKISYGDGQEFNLGGPTGLSLTSMRSEWLATQDDLTAPIPAAVQTYMDNTHYFVGVLGVFSLALIAIYIVHNLKFSTGGRALLAIREDPIASEAVGIPTTRYKVVAFVIGAAIAGAAGGVLSHHKSLVNPESFRFMSSSYTGSITLVAMVILGGQGSITGSVLAAAALTVIPEVLRTGKGWIYGHLHGSHTAWIDHLGDWVNTLDIDKWRMVIYSLVIIGMMLFRPNGIFGRYEINDLWRLFTKKRNPAVSALPLDCSDTISNLLQPPKDAKERFTRAGADGAALLTANQIVMQFGGLRAVDDFSLSLRPGELVGLIGPNGAGKTTVFNVLTGVYAATTGTIAICGKPVTGRRPGVLWTIRIVAGLIVLLAFWVAKILLSLQALAATTAVVAALAGLFALLTFPEVARRTQQKRGKWITLGLTATAFFVTMMLIAWIPPAVLLPLPLIVTAYVMWRGLAENLTPSGRKTHQICKLGVARTFQNIRLFQRLSVLDNVQIAQHMHQRRGIPSALLRIPGFFRAEETSRNNALALLKLFNLDAFAHEQASSLCYGDQRRLEIARALATRPRLLLLDEPAAGMNPTEKRQLMDLIRDVRTRFGLAILIIEHDMKVIMGICERIIVLDYGKTIAQGTPEEIRRHPAVIEAYLGASAKQG